jgi:hypothetical protein
MGLVTPPLTDPEASGRSLCSMDQDWAELPEELFLMVLDHLSRASWAGNAHQVRGVCERWARIHDSTRKELHVTSHKKLDAALQTRLLISMCSKMPALTSLKLEYCDVTDQALRAVCELPALTDLQLSGCIEVTDEGLACVGAVSTLTSLLLSYLPKVTSQGLHALASLPPTLTKLSLRELDSVTEEVLRDTVARLTGLTHLDLNSCTNVTEKGILTLRTLTSLTLLQLDFCFESFESWIEEGSDDEDVRIWEQSESVQRAEEQLCQAIPGLQICREHEMMCLYCED